MNEIPVKDSIAKWEQNPNYSDDFTLVEREIILGENWLHDKTKVRIYGWIERVKFGDNIGQFEAVIPTINDNGDGSDIEIIGYFETVEIAMEEILKKNHPNYGCWM